MLDDLRRLTEVDVGLAPHPAALHRLAQFWILKVRPRLFREMNSIATNTSSGSSALR